MQEKRQSLEEMTMQELSELQEKMDARIKELEQENKYLEEREAQREEMKKQLQIASATLLQETLAFCKKNRPKF